MRINPEMAGIEAIELPPSDEERMERRQTHVATLIRLEELLKKDSIALDDRLIRNVLEPLPKPIQELALQATRKFREKLKEAQQADRLLAQSAREAGFREDETGLGAYLFTLRTGREPRGMVRLRRAESYFIINTSTREDYRDFYHPGLQARSDDASMKEKQLVEKHGGSYHRSVPVEVPRYMRAGENYTYIDDIDLIGPSVLLVKGDPGASAYVQIVTHERQHHINHEFVDLFAKTERRFVSEERRSRDARIKDEVLAFIRDGSTAEEFEHSLLDPLYEHLFGSGETATALKQTVRAIARELKRHQSVFMRLEARQALVYHLLDVQLPEIAKHLRLVARLYNDRRERVEETIVDLPDWFLAEGYAETQQPSFRRVYRETSQLFDRYDAMYEDTLVRLYQGDERQFAAGVMKMREAKKRIDARLLELEGLRVERRAA